jgi:hypothetical protein
MKWLKLKVLFLLTLVTTLVITNIPRHTEVDPIIKPYVETLSKLTKGNIGSYHAIGFSDINRPRVLANCRITLLNSDITFDRESWEESSVKKRLLILAHELIHCEKGQGHKSEKEDKKGCPLYLMSPIIGSEYCIANNFYKYIKQASDK